MKSNTRPSREISSARGKVPGKVLSTALTPREGEQQARAIPPRPASRTLSVRSWRTTRQWPAPSAARTANSRVRPMERASKKIRDVGARNQQQESDRGQQHQQERLDVADDIFLHGNQRDAGVFIRRPEKRQPDCARPRPCRPGPAPASRPASAVRCNARSPRYGDRETTDRSTGRWAYRRRGHGRKK